MRKGVFYNFRRWFSNLIKPKELEWKSLSSEEQKFYKDFYFGSIHNSAKKDLIEYKYPPSDTIDDCAEGELKTYWFNKLADGEYSEDFIPTISKKEPTPEENLSRIMNEAFPDRLHNVGEQSNIEQISERLSKQATENMQSSYHFGSAIFLASFIEMIANDYELEDMIDVFDEMIDNTEGLSELVDVILMDLEN